MGRKRARLGECVYESSKCIHSRHAIAVPCVSGVYAKELRAPRPPRPAARVRARADPAPPPPQNAIAAARLDAESSLLGTQPPPQPQQMPQPQPQQAVSPPRYDPAAAAGWRDSDDWQAIPPLPPNPVTGHSHGHAAPGPGSLCGEAL
jgi:hypothetical protein